MTAARDVLAHYERGSLADRIIAALDAAGLADARLAIGDLAPLDQFHTGSLRATADLAAALRIPAGASVLDVGSGLGGAARYLASELDCDVRGIDLSASFVDAARLLTERSGLTDRVRFDVGNALALPCADAAFDFAWTQHAAMNVRDRAGMYSELFRVLRPGARLGISDILAGSGALHFPVPWAADAHTSFLMDAAALRHALETAGFSITSWVDRTANSVTSLGNVSRAAKTSASSSSASDRAHSVRAPLDLQLVMGTNFPRMAANLALNLREGRATVAEIVAEKPSS